MSGGREGLTYGELLLWLVVVPVIAVGALLLWEGQRGRRAGVRKGVRSGQNGQVGWLPWALLAALLVVAVVYTIPWDSHLIARGVWWYKRSLISGAMVFGIPLEELLFFPLQTLLVGLWTIWLTMRVAGRGHDRAREAQEARRAGGARAMRLPMGHIRVEHIGRDRSAAIRLGATVASGAGWLLALVIVWRGWPPGTYLGWELLWALPPLMLQLGLGGDILWRHRGIFLAALAPAVLYLSLVDAFAIYQGIWTISARLALGLLIGNLLPLEEVVFFLLTSALIVGGLVLGNEVGSSRRLSRRGGYEPTREQTVSTIAH